MTHENLAHETVCHCRNCGAAVTYHYCAVCGQETTVHVASAREFLHEFIGHYVALEGKLWKSLALLLLRPGRLTSEYVAGRRARYVQPLRVYLTCSIVFFALFKFGNYTVAQWDEKAGAPSRQAVSEARPAKPDGKDRKIKLQVGGDEAFADKMFADNPDWEQKWARFEALTPVEMSRFAANSFFSYAPYAMFLLMPVFAAYLKMLYLGSGRYYGEHMLFALHANAFAFAMFTLVLVLPWGPFRLLGLGWLLAYLPLAMRHVYGGSRLLTGLRWLTLMALHLISIALVLAGGFFFLVFR